MNTRTYSRRYCLKVIGLLSASTLFPNFFVKPVFSSTTPKLKKISRTLPLMSTYVTITIYDTSLDRAYDAREMAFAKIKELINIFNRFDNNTQLSYLNKNKKLTDIPPDFLKLLKQAKEVAKITSTKFDITVLPLLELIENEIKTHGHFPSPKLIQEILPYVGWKNIHISSKEITLSSESKITLDGIAKGYIVDQAAEVLKGFNVRHAIIDAGGDIRCVGAKGDSPWIIGIEDPYLKKEYIQTIKIKDLAIATSGSYRNFFDSAKKHFHIIDKQGVISPQRTISCSIICKNATLADGLATGFFAISPEESLALANHYNIPIFILTHGGRIFTSNLWNNFTV